MRMIVVVLAVLALAGGTAVMGATYGWDGGASPATNSFTTDANWRSDTEAPLTGGHNVEILASQLVSPFSLTSDWDYGSSTTGSYGTVDVQSNGSYAMTFKKSGAGSFTATTLTLIGHNSSFKATLDADVALTLTNIRAKKDVILDVANNVTVDVNGTLDATAIDGATTCEKIGSGSITPDTVYARGGDASGETGRLHITAGTITASAASTPFTSIEAAATVTANATIEFDGGSFDPGGLRILGGTLTTGGLSLFDYDGGTLTAPDTIRMAGWSKIDAETDFDVDGDLIVAVEAGNAFSTEATLDLVDYTDVKKIQIVGGSQTGQTSKLIVTGSALLQTDGAP